MGQSRQAYAAWVRKEEKKKRVNKREEKKDRMKLFEIMMAVFVVFGPCTFLIVAVGQPRHSSLMLTDSEECRTDEDKRYGKLTKR